MRGNLTRLAVRQPTTSSSQNRPQVVDLDTQNRTTEAAVKYSFTEIEVMRNATACLFGHADMAEREAMVQTYMVNGTTPSDLIQEMRKCGEAIGADQLERRLREPIT